MVGVHGVVAEEAVSVVSQDVGRRFLLCSMKVLSLVDHPGDKDTEWEVVDGGLRWYFFPFSTSHYFVGLLRASGLK